MIKKQSVKIIKQHDKICGNDIKILLVKGKYIEWNNCSSYIDICRSNPWNVYLSLTEQTNISAKFVVYCIFTQN